MRRLMLSLVAAVLVIGAATSVLRPHALRSAQSGMPNIQELQTGQASTLAEQEIEDRSVLFARERTH